MAKLAKTGIIVGKTHRRRLDQKYNQHSGNSITMGKNVPRAKEGRVGDISVREIRTAGLRVYIKTQSGWIDINQMTNVFMPQWINMKLAGSWATDSTYGTPQYMKDTHGFVQLRGGVDSGSHSSTITTLPAGYRPQIEQRRLVLRALDSGLLTQQIRIQTTGVITMPYGQNIDLGSVPNTWSTGTITWAAADTTTEVSLDNVSFFVGKKPTSASSSGSVPGGHTGQGTTT